METLKSTVQLSSTTIISAHNIPSTLSFLNVPSSDAPSVVPLLLHKTHHFTITRASYSSSGYYIRSPVCRLSTTEALLHLHCILISSSKPKRCNAQGEIKEHLHVCRRYTHLLCSRGDGIPALGRYLQGIPQAHCLGKLSLNSLRGAA